MDSENLNMTAVQRFRADLAFGKYQEIAAKLLNLLDELERLQAENAELKSHIERWAVEDRLFYGGESYHSPYEHDPGMCELCGDSWPCPTEVVKGWKE